MKAPGCRIFSFQLSAFCFFSSFILPPSSFPYAMLYWTTRGVGVGCLPEGGVLMGTLCRWIVVSVGRMPAIVAFLALTTLISGCAPTETMVGRWLEPGGHGAVDIDAAGNVAMIDHTGHVSKRSVHPLPTDRPEDILSVDFVNPDGVVIPAKLQMVGGKLTLEFPDPRKAGSFRHEVFSRLDIQKTMAAKK
jgi:hypothetical protein